MVDRYRFPTVAANWEHFDSVDIAPNAPPVQRNEMKRAFMAGLSSGLVLALNAQRSADQTGEIKKVWAELQTFMALRKAGTRK